jgi:hypothetical protein
MNDQLWERACARNDVATEDKDSRASALPQV